MTKVYFETFGCSANVADSEQMAGLLTEAQFEIVNQEELADVIIINSCTVKGPTESAIMRRLEELKDGYKIVIIAGCMAQADSKKLEGYSLIGTNQIHRVVEVVEEALHDNVIRAVSMNDRPPLNTPLVRKNPFIDIIPINRGCLGFCTFCKTKSARGNLISYPVEEIVQRAQKAVKEGVKEIWLTSQDTGCYGFDIDTDLPTLLEQLVSIPGNFKIRIGMMNPDYMPKIQKRLIEFYKHPKVFKFLHLPLQAGDNTVLENMKRMYTVEQYLEQIEAFKKEVPGMNFMTDIIVGFPGESEEQFFKTLNVVRQTSPDSINISRFWPRPNTPAERMKDKVPGDEIKRRSRVLTDIFHNISRLQNEKWVGWSGPIIIDDKGKRENQWVGRNDSYKQILITGNYKLGDVIDVKIVRSDTFSLIAEPTTPNFDNKNSNQPTGVKLKVYY